MTATDALPDGTRTAIRTCPLCEAGCGLEITVRDQQVVRIRGDRDDVFSRGFICPKGSTLKQLHEDPDRLRRPLIRRDGVHVEVTWEEAWEEVRRRLAEFFARHGRAAMATYHGNPIAHSLGAMVYSRPFSQALGNTVRFTASTVDQLPRQVASGFVFGSSAAVPVPDVDHTDLLVVIGANPMVSNGSLCTAPDFPGRLQRLRERGGRLVVIDPVCTKTAEQADLWLAIRPGTDALALAAMITELHAAGRIETGAHLAEHLSGLDAALAALAPFTPESVTARVGVPAADLRALAGQLADAPTAAVYGRIGTTTSGFGTVTSWLIDVLNTVTGNLDRRGGSMFPLPAAAAAWGGSNRTGFSLGERRSRVSGHQAVLGEIPAAAMAEEIVVPGEGQIRGLVTMAGNPVLSTPHSRQLDAALDELELMISVDIYLNETTRHADVILPPPSPLQRSHYDLALLPFAVRNVANYSDPVLHRGADEPDEWEIIAKLALLAQGAPADADPHLVTGLVVAALLRSAVEAPGSPVHGRSADELDAALGDEQGPARILDVMLQLGPYGAGFGADPDGLSLANLREHPHGVDLGPLQPRIPDVLHTTSGCVELAPAPIIADIARLAAVLAEPVPDAVLVGRRHLRSNNSWMHNLGVLVRGPGRCTLQVHPDDAARWGLVHGASAVVTSRVGSVEAPVEVTDSIRTGVVSLPHGWGHDAPGTRQRIASEHAGVNSNVLTDERAIDPLSATSTLNGIPVTITPGPAG